MGHTLAGETVRTLIVVAIIMLAAACVAYPRDLDHRYPAGARKEWFDSLGSRRGPCCSVADGRTVLDVDWRRTGDGFQVYVDGRWMDVPADALVTVPNLDGRAIIWPVYENGVIKSIRCFMPGGES